MKIVFLRGGTGAQSAASDTGITALGSGDGHWLLLNVTAAVARQLANDTALLAHRGLADAASRAVVLTDAQLENVSGLLGLRGGAPIDLYATPAVFEELTTALPVLPVLQHYCGVHWRVVPVAGDRRVAPFRVEGMPTLEFTAISTRMPAPPHRAPHRQPVVGDSVAIAVRDLVTDQRVFCAPGLTRIGPFEFDWMRQADCVLVDGEPDVDAAAAPGLMDLLSDMPARHKVLFCDPGAARRDQLADRGIEVAHDGMEIEL